MKNYVDINIQSNLSFVQTRDLVKENVWKRNETFFFVNQASSKKKGYPCMTTKDSSDPGKPCSFPFNWMYKQNTCTVLNSNGQHWCYTKVSTDRTVDRSTYEHWGACSPNCNGELFEPSSKHNLAKKEFVEAWDSDIYDMRTYDDGYCHTFNPEEKQDLSFDFRLGLFLGHQSMNSFEEFHFKFFKIFIHEKDQFWPRKDWKNQEQLVIGPN